VEFLIARLSFVLVIASLTPGCRAFYDFDDIRRGGDAGELRYPRVFGLAGLPEGLGHRVDALCDPSDSSCELDVEVVSEAPVYLPVEAGDVVEIELPDFGEHDWTLCGGALPPGTVVKLDELASPCAQSESAAVFTLAVPVDRGAGHDSGERSVVVRVSRGGEILRNEIPIVALDEGYHSTQSATIEVSPRVPYSLIYIDQLYEPQRSRVAIEWIAVTSALIRAKVRVSGENGDGECDAPCEGGDGGVGSMSGGGGASDTSPDNPRRGMSGGDCAQVCTADTTAGTGGGGGSVDVGAVGSAGAGCPGGQAAGGLSLAGDPFLIELDAHFGAGGGRGADLECMGLCSGPLYGGGGGGGGGVLGLRALGDIELYRNGLSEIVNARGGDGGASQTCADGGLELASGAGGAGSGGAISMSAPTIRVTGAHRDLAVLLRIAPGAASSQGGAGSIGWLRVDGEGGEVDALDLSSANVTRGPNTPSVDGALVSLDPIVTLKLALYEADQLTRVGVRPADDEPGDDVYELEPVSEGDSIELVLEPGLSEVCVILEGGLSGGVAVADVPERAKRCTWIAHLP